MTWRTIQGEGFSIREREWLRQWVVPSVVSNYHLRSRGLQHGKSDGWGFYTFFLYQRPKEFVFSSHHLPRTTAHDEAVILWACVTKYLDLAKRNASCKDYAQQQQQIASNFRVPNEVLTSHSIILKGDRLWNVLNCRIPVLPYCCCVYATFDW